MSLTGGGRPGRARAGSLRCFALQLSLSPMTNAAAENRRATGGASRPIKRLREAEFRGIVARNCILTAGSTRYRATMGILRTGS